MYFKAYPRPTYVLCIFFVLIRICTMHIDVYYRQPRPGRRSGCAKASTTATEPDFKLLAAMMELPPEVRDVVRPDFHHVNLDVENYIKSELGIKLDKGTSSSRHCNGSSHDLPQRFLLDEQICKLALTPGGCPRGLDCPLRHTTPSALNFQPPPQPPVHPRDRERLATVRFTLSLTLSK